MEGIRNKHIQQLLRVRFQPCRCDFLSVFTCLLGENEPPAHPPGSSEHSATGVAMPSRMDSRIPGIETR